MEIRGQAQYSVLDMIAYHTHVTTNICMETSLHGAEILAFSGFMTAYIRFSVQALSHLISSHLHQVCRSCFHDPNLALSVYSMNMVKV